MRRRSRATLTSRPGERRDPYAVCSRQGIGAEALLNNESRWLWVPAFAGTTRREAFSQRPLAIFAVGEAGFLQIEIAFDPPPDLVGDLAVAQQNVDEFPLRRDQLPRQGRALRRDLACFGIERVRQLVGADLVPRPQQSDHLVGQFAIVGDGVERLERRRERFAPRYELRFMLRQMFGAAGLPEAKLPDHRRQPEPQSHQRDEDDAERDEQDEVTVGEILATGKRE